MRFGFMLFTRDLLAVGEIARLAENRGFDLIGIADSPALSFDPYMALTLAALNTTRARVGRRTLSRSGRSLLHKHRRPRGRRYASRP